MIDATLPVGSCVIVDCGDNVLLCGRTRCKPFAMADGSLAVQLLGFTKAYPLSAIRYPEASEPQWSPVSPSAGNGEGQP